MKPESASRRNLSITRSKGKMYELGLREEFHIKIPKDVEPAALFPLSIGMLMDASAAINDAAVPHTFVPEELKAELNFAASFFDAYLDARFDTTLSREVTLLASASYFLGERPGSSLVLARRLSIDNTNTLENLIVWVLQANWQQLPRLGTSPINALAKNVAEQLMSHFNNGTPSILALDALYELRQVTYVNGTPREVVLVEITSAVARLRLSSSAWTLLPDFSQLNYRTWFEAIRRTSFPKELWPSQKLLGEAGVFRGHSAVVQMPTSAGKTRSIEIILRSAFLSNRTRAAVLVAPFRALSHEIATSLRHSFKGEDVKVNEISDTLQLDFLDQLKELFGYEASTARHLIVVTPEKLLYLLRQAPSLTKQIGLVVYDEGHQFDNGSRGVTYELLLTEIKNLLEGTSQTVLISAVIKNADAIGTWLIGPKPNVVNGNRLLSTARSIAFAAWADHEELGQLLFYEAESYTTPSYYVPRSIERQALTLRKNERKSRFFPDNEDTENSWKDVSLYLGIRLAPNGAAAVFCGRKDTATGLVERAVEVYERGFRLPRPSTTSNPKEIRRLTHLAAKNFGHDSATTKAAALGIFVHHGTTPQGIRLAIEHAMQHEHIKLVICTSTLAQGVNLPIRYLIVSGTNQGGERIKTRDFQNLIGRAGRAGMHTEGLILFADPRIMGRKKNEPWRLETSIELLQQQNSEDISSSLIELLAPFPSTRWLDVAPFPTSEVFNAYFLPDNSLENWATEMRKSYPLMNLDVRSLAQGIRARRRLLSALESYLMANRGTDSFQQFKERARKLAMSTLAYSLAEDRSRDALVQLFEFAAEHIEQVVPEPMRQFSYAKTLLSAAKAAFVEAWTLERANMLGELSTPDEWLHAVWPLLLETVNDKLLTKTIPNGLPLQLTQAWIQGVPYGELIAMTKEASATKPWGDNNRRDLSAADVLEFLEGCLGFDCPLVLAAVGQFLHRENELTTEHAVTLNDFHKSLKYGLPNKLSISAYEAGFADRCVAQDIANDVRLAGYQGSSIDFAVNAHRHLIVKSIEAYPEYFDKVLAGL